MYSKPVIFISAVSKELRCARELVARVLLSLGYDPVWQDMFGSDSGTVRDMLKRKIDAAQGVVQLVGSCYGTPAKLDDEDVGTASYTQFEALYARRSGKQVWYLLLAPGFPVDAHEQEPEELRRLQEAYREGLQAGSHLYYPLSSASDIELRIMKLRDELELLRRRNHRWALSVFFLLVLIAFGGLWVVWRQQQTSDQMLVLAAQNERLIKAQAEIGEAVIRGMKGGSDAKLQSQYEASLDFVARQHGLTTGALRESLESHALTLVTDSKTEAKDKIHALKSAGLFVQARDFSVAAATSLRARREHQSAQESELWSEAAATDLRLGHYAAAFEHASHAASIVDRETHFPEWSSARHVMARTLLRLLRYQEGIAIYQELIPLQVEKLGAEHPDTLSSRNADLLLRQFQQQMSRTESKESRAAKLRAFGDEHKTLLEIRTRVLGADHPDTLLSRNNYAELLKEQGYYPEAEAEIREVLAGCTRSLGSDHPDTLITRGNLAATLARQKKFAEAEKEFKTVIAGQKALLGADHPDTLLTRSNMAENLRLQGKTTEAEQELRSILTLTTEMAGPASSQAIHARENLIMLLESEGKNAEVEVEERLLEENKDSLAVAVRPIVGAGSNRITDEMRIAGALRRADTQAERDLRGAVVIQTKSHGETAPEVLRLRYQLGVLLQDQGLHGDAVKEFRMLLLAQEKALKVDHPDVLQTCQHLAQSLIADGKSGEVLPLLNRAEAGWKALVGADAPETLAAQELQKHLKSNTSRPQTGDVPSRTTDNKENPEGKQPN